MLKRIYKRGLSHDDLVLWCDLKKSTSHDIIKAKEKIKEVMKKVDHRGREKNQTSAMTPVEEEKQEELRLVKHSLASQAAWTSLWQEILSFFKLLSASKRRQTLSDLMYSIIYFVNPYPVLKHRLTAWLNTNRHGPPSYPTFNLAPPSLISHVPLFGIQAAVPDPTGSQPASPCTLQQ